jgi:hypothetical protein
VRDIGAPESILPDEITRLAIKLGKGILPSPHTELVLPYSEALRAIRIATEHDIAVLGLEAHEVKTDGLLTIGLADASAYIRYAGDWKVYVAKMNSAAELWITEHRLGENHGYILTSTSEREFIAESDKNP